MKPEASLLNRWVIRGPHKLILTYDGLREFSADAVALCNRLAERHQEAGVPDFGISEELSVFLSRLNKK